jgi:molybdate transport system ATP-binding protein
MSVPELAAELEWSPQGSDLKLDLAIALNAESGILFGASGSGKSSTLRLIAGLDRPQRGFIRLGNTVLFDSAKRINLPLRDRGIGLIFQDDLLFPHLNVLSNVRFGLKGWGRAESETRVLEVARLCGIESLLNRWPETLSGGERQRVGLARALAPRPRLLLCDEPVSALDYATRDLLIDRIRSIQISENIPLLYVTHSPSEALALGSRLFRLDRGKICDEGRPLDVLARVSNLPLSDVNNRFEATVLHHEAAGGETVLRIHHGPDLIVPLQGREVGSQVVVRVRSDDILLARGPIAGLSARNVLAGTIDRVISHGSEAEVLVKTEESSWTVSLVSPALGALGLSAGVSVYMIIKARSCHVTAHN